MAAGVFANFDRSAEYQQRDRGLAPPITTDPQLMSKRQRLIATAAAERQGLVQQPHGHPMYTAPSPLLVEKLNRIREARRRGH